MFIPWMIGTWQLLIIVLVVVLLFGGAKIPELMRGMGRGVKEFKDAMNTDYSAEEERKKEADPEPEKKTEKRTAGKSVRKTGGKTERKTPGKSARTGKE